MQTGKGDFRLGEGEDKEEGIAVDTHTPSSASRGQTNRRIETNLHTQRRESFVQEDGIVLSQTCSFESSRPTAAPSDVEAGLHFARG